MEHYLVYFCEILKKLILEIVFQFSIKDINNCFVRWRFNSEKTFSRACEAVLITWKHSNSLINSLIDCTGGNFKIRLFYESILFIMFSGCGIVIFQPTFCLDFLLVCLQFYVLTKVFRHSNCCVSDLWSTF